VQAPWALCVMFVTACPRSFELAVWLLLAASSPLDALFPPPCRRFLIQVGATSGPKLSFPDGMLSSEFCYSPLGGNGGPTGAEGTWLRLTCLSKSCVFARSPAQPPAYSCKAGNQSPDGTPHAVAVHAQTATCPA
jgi:hypothetical protein